MTSGSLLTLEEEEEDCSLEDSLEEDDSTLSLDEGVTSAQEARNKEDNNKIDTLRNFMVDRSLFIVIEVLHGEASIVRVDGTVHRIEIGKLETEASHAIHFLLSIQSEVEVISRFFLVRI